MQFTRFSSLSRCLPRRMSLSRSDIIIVLFIFFVYTSLLLSSLMNMLPKVADLHTQPREKDRVLRTRTRFKLTNDIRVRYGCQYPSNSSEYTSPVLTLFTSWPSSFSAKYKIYNNTMKNWSLLRPLVRPLVFTNDPYVRKQCKQSGWMVLPESQAGPKNYPILKEMFIQAKLASRTCMYGFANGDMLFDESLIETLIFILNERLTVRKPMVLLGTRTNVANVSLDEATDLRKLQTASNARGIIDSKDAMDFFITNYNYPWADFAPVVIGLKGFDNWIVMRSRELKFTVVDVSSTLLAVHQTNAASDVALRDTRRDPDYNIRLINKMYSFPGIRINFGHGYSDKTGWMIVRDKNTRRMMLIERPKELYGKMAM